MDNKKKIISPKNINEQFHGYQEWYDSKNSIWYRGNCKNNNFIGYIEYHDPKEVGFFIR